MANDCTEFSASKCPECGESEGVCWCLEAEEMSDDELEEAFDRRNGKD